MRGSLACGAGLVIFVLGGCVSTSRTEYPGGTAALASAPAQIGQIAKPSVVEVTGFSKAGFDFVVAARGSRAAVIFKHGQVPPISLQMQAVKEATGCDALPNPPGEIWTSGPDPNGMRLGTMSYDLLCPSAALT